MDDPEQEVDVNIIFCCEDFELIVRWQSDASASDEARLAGASEWFTEKYGFNPNDYAETIHIRKRNELT